MDKILYMKDCYLKEFEAEVLDVVDEKFVVLDKSAFYPNSGGQPHDTGKLIKEKESGDDRNSEDGEEFNVVFVAKKNGKISHEVDKPGLAKGDKVKGIIDWDRRYVHMRYHSAAHVLSAVLHKETGAQITGNQLSAEKARIDFNLPEFDKEAAKEYIDKANEVIAKATPVNIKILPREEAFNIPGLMKLKMQLPESIKEIRIIDIEGFDEQACGGTHVKNLSEIGKLEFLKAENKGKENRRIYFKLQDE